MRTITVRAGAGIILAVGLIASIGLGPQPAAAGEDEDVDVAVRGRRYCSATALLQFYACRHEVRDDFAVARAICLNLSNTQARMACSNEAKSARNEEVEVCSEQFEAREDLCEAIGEGRYDPPFNAAAFDSDFTNLTKPNSYFPLGIGSTWTYAGGDEVVVIEVLSKTKLINGVTCIVVNDLVEVDGEKKEDTDDWFAQAKNGTVYYCGESVKDFETFPGDVPAEPELVAIDGSFKAGRDGDKPGILFLGAPLVGAVYRQEWSPGNAEDAAQILSKTYDFGDNATLDELVPQDLADLLCNNDCVVTAEFTPIEPGVFQRKYYARGIGKFLEVNPESGDVVQLVDCNVDPKCASLPAP